MKKLTVSSLPIQSVISDIARELGTRMNKDCGIFSVELPERHGTGRVIGTDFNDGLAFIRYDCTFKHDMVIEYTVDEIHPVKFLFCNEGEIRHRFMNEDHWHDISKYRNAVVASSAHNGHGVRFLANERMVYNSIELDRRQFQGKISCEPSSIPKSWRDMLNDVTAKRTFYHDGFYSLTLARQFKVWDDYTVGDWLMKLNLEAMAYNIFVNQIRQFQDDIKSDDNKSLFRRAELNQMVRAVEIIDERLGDLPTVTEIAAEVGLNANKLQQGFKEIFGTTANIYIKRKRLEKVRRLIADTDHTLSVIAGMVGYKSQSYMTKIFTKFYGVRPSEYRKNGEHYRILPPELKVFEGY